MLHSKVRILSIQATVCIATLLVMTPCCYGDIIPNGTSEFCQLSGFVYHDMDNDGTRGPEEWLLPDIEVCLSGVTLGGQTINLVTSTKSFGSYHFEDIPAGTYSVKETQPEFLYTAIANEPGTAGGSCPNSNEFVNIQLDPGIIATDYNFGEWGLKVQYMSKRDFIVVVPEPSAILMLGFLFAGTSFYLFRRRHR